MPAIRPLPARPSLEYARKEAKAFLRRLRAGDPEALARALAQDPPLDRKPPGEIRLADAQLALAREHGFASWPRLVRWIGDAERQQHAHTQLHFGPDQYEAEARWLIDGHRARRPLAGRSLAAFVPRLYGLGADEVFASEVSEDEARLAVARGHGAPSWEVLVERLEGNARTRPADQALDPLRDARAAMDLLDGSALERVIAAHPELLHPSEMDISAGHTLMATALWAERKHGAAAVRPLMEWLEGRGLDRQLELNRRLCGHGIGRPTPETVRELLGQGADPSWVPPNGIPVLEHALLRYWNGAAVDVIAERVTPRRALWIAAGLGDVDGVRRFLDDQGRPTPAARRFRPDFVAVGAHGMLPQLPEADDEEILLEALFVAVLNGRTPVLEYLASRGAPLDSLRYGMTLLTFAAANGLASAAAVVESLVRCGADPDLRGWGVKETAREAARTNFEHGPEMGERRRILVALGMHPDAVLAERNARPPVEPFVIPGLKSALAFASVDAARLGQSEVRPDNLLVGLLRSGVSPLPYLAGLKVDLARLRSDMIARLPLPLPPDWQTSPKLAMDPDAQGAWDASIAHAVGLRRVEVTGFNLLHALIDRDDGTVSEMLAGYGVNVTELQEKLAGSL